MHQPHLVYLHVGALVHVFSIDWKLNLFIIEFLSLREGYLCFHLDELFCGRTENEKRQSAMYIMHTAYVLRSSGRLRDLSIL